MPSNLEHARPGCGLESTVRYLGIEVDDSRVLSEQTDL
jgi:hypothetical protein